PQTPEETVPRTALLRLGFCRRGGLPRPWAEGGRGAAVRPAPQRVRHATWPSWRTPSSAQPLPGPRVGAKKKRGRPFAHGSGAVAMVVRGAHRPGSAAAFLSKAPSRRKFHSATRTSGAIRAIRVLPPATTGVAVGSGDVVEALRQRQDDRYLEEPRRYDHGR